MDISRIRQINLEAIIKEDFGGNKAECARALGKDPSYISRLFSEGSARRKIGHNLARKIEVVTKKPKSWLDSRHGIETDEVMENLTSYQQELLVVVGALDDDQKKVLLDMAKAIRKINLKPAKSVDIPVPEISSNKPLAR